MTTTQPYPPVAPVPPEPPVQPRRRHTLRWVLVGLAALLPIVLVVVGVLTVANGPSPSEREAGTQAPTQSGPPSASEPSAPPSSEPPGGTTENLAVGQTATITIDGSAAGTLTVTKVSTAVVEPGEFGSSPDRGLFLIVHLGAVGTGVPFDVNAFEFSVTGSDGTHYEDATFSGAWGPEFSGTTLNSGEHSNGTLVFDVSRTAKHGKVIYAPNYDGVPVATWIY